MKMFLTLVCCMILAVARPQLLTWTPDFIKEGDASIVVTVDAAKGNQGLKDFIPTDSVYVHTGLITSYSTSASDWKHVKYTSFNTPSPIVNATYQGNNKWSFTISGGLRAFYSVTDPAEKILKITMLFRNKDGSKVQRNTDGSDMYIPVYDAGLQVKITNPFTQPRYVPVPETIIKNVGDAISITGKASQSADLKLFLNGAQIGTTATNTTSISASPTLAAAGNQQIVAEAVSAGITKRDTINFYVNAATVTAGLPAGVRDGINYSSDATSVTLVLFAPEKSTVSVIGDFNDWTRAAQYQMNRTPDAKRYWVKLTGLTPGVEYGFQYVIDDVLSVADIYTEKVLDPWNDQYISTTTYPNLKPYPVGKTTGIVSILQTQKPTYNWQENNFVRPNKGNLIVYELLVRDFVYNQNWQSMIDSLPYLKNLNINTIELMPVNEFEGNNSWGYNPDFYFATDKAYGTEQAFKAFIDACHRNGIAVVMDIAMNHAFGLSPTVQMYFNSVTNKPADNNPWHNVDPTHPYNVGYDFNHEAQPTKDLVDRVVEHWLTNYKIDGFRWDLSKGFTQRNSGTATSDVGAWNVFDQGRIDTWKRIYDKMQSVSTGSFCILEHFAESGEENVLAGYGMILWRNRNNAYNQSTMGYPTDADFGWSGSNFVTYQESHDEERLMYKNEQFGNQNGSYSTRSVRTGLLRNAMAASFWAMQPSQKMMWQFGELGYDSSIAACNNGQAPNAEGCRTSPKPMKWDYNSNTFRKALYNTYSKLLQLRKVPAYLPTFTSNSIGGSLGGDFKWFQVTTDALKICVIGNFGVTEVTGNVTFQNAGTWYGYVGTGITTTVTTRTATGNSEAITLQPGEYYVYLDRDPTAALNTLSYTFEKTGNWSDAANWKNGNKPPAILPAGAEINVSPQAGGECILDIQQTISPGARFFVTAGASFKILGSLQ